MVVAMEEVMQEAKEVLTPRRIVEVVTKVVPPRRSYVSQSPNNIRKTIWVVLSVCLDRPDLYFVLPLISVRHEMYLNERSEGVMDGCLLA